MGFGPDKTRVNDSDLVQPPKFAQTQRQKLFRFKCSADPTTWRLKPSLTISAEMKDTFARNTLADIDCQSNTILTESAR